MKDGQDRDVETTRKPHPIRRIKPLPSGTARKVAKKLRSGMTFPERLLWSRLRAGRLDGLKFIRQHAIGQYVVDFYCASARLILEIDGESHRGRLAEDEQRQAEIEAMGYRFFRVTHDDVVKNLDSVLLGIVRAAQGT